MDFKAAGPYKILKKVKNLYRVKLPLSIKVYLIISLNRLRKAPDDTILGQINDPLPAVVVDGDIEYEVKYLLALKMWRRKL